MSFVLDSSVSAAWGFPDEEVPYADKVLTQLQFTTAVVPALWPFEIASVLLVGERRGRLTAAQAQRFVDDLRMLPIIVDDVAWLALVPLVLALGREFGLSAYDAAYLELAARRGLPLATLDARLRDAAARHGVPLL